MSTASDLFRAEATANDNVRDAGLTTPPDILRWDDIAYGPDSKNQSLDVYRPRTVVPGKRLPVIVSVHGGAWVYGDKERYQYYCMSLAQRGFAVVNFTYRLAPEFQFPSSLEDTNLVFSWVLENGEAFGFDREHVFAVGDSAGGHLLGLYACFCTDPEFAAQFSFAPPPGFVPTALGLNCGKYRINAASDARTRALMKDLLPKGATEDELALIQVVDHVTDRFPPCFIMTSSGDFLRDQPLAMVERFMELKIPFVFRTYGDGKNLLPHVFHCDLRSADGQLCNDEECAFFREFC